MAAATPTSSQTFPFAPTDAAVATQKSDVIKRVHEVLEKISLALAATRLMQVLQGRASPLNDQKKVQQEIQGFLESADTLLLVDDTERAKNKFLDALRLTKGKAELEFLIVRSVVLLDLDKHTFSAEEKKAVLYQAKDTFFELAEKRESLAQEGVSPEDVLNLLIDLLGWLSNHTEFLSDRETFELIKSRESACQLARSAAKGQKGTGERKELPFSNGPSESTKRIRTLFAILALGAIAAAVAVIYRRSFMNLSAKAF